MTRSSVYPSHYLRRPRATQVVRPRPPGARSADAGMSDSLVQLQYERGTLLVVRLTAHDFARRSVGGSGARVGRPNEEERLAARRALRRKRVSPVAERRAASCYARARSAYRRSAVEVSRNRSRERR